MDFGSPLEKEDYMLIILVIIGIIVLAVAIRELICWYYKINDLLAGQKETNRLLRKIAGEPELVETDEEK